MDERQLADAIESLLVARNPRGMQTLRRALAPGYYLRAARLVHQARGCVLIGTGFPVGERFETDGPAGAIALHDYLRGCLHDKPHGSLHNNPQDNRHDSPHDHPQDNRSDSLHEKPLDNPLSRGAEPVIACAPPLCDVLRERCNVFELPIGPQPIDQVQADLARLRPGLVISIELPGRGADGRHRNMRGEDIGHLCPHFDPYMELADCPTIAIGDGGNEVGMGKVADAVAGLGVSEGASAGVGENANTNAGTGVSEGASAGVGENANTNAGTGASAGTGSSAGITPAITGCDELLLADVSNWGAYGIMALVGLWRGEDPLGAVSHPALLQWLCARGGVDGVTRAPTPTEDGFSADVGAALIDTLRELTN